MFNTAIDHHRSDGLNITVFDKKWETKTTLTIIILVVIIPTAFALLLCILTYCIYRYNRRRNEATGLGMRTQFPAQHSSQFLIEDSPPAYDSISEIKKQLPTTNESESSAPPPPSYTELVWPSI
ncbi:unnamed protein product [Didymodactylos carnosus]|uniref:Uncharacterized protein n=1 Tax=Didymodactylos carnosus TaxID=1234261 RepID=A0A814F1Z9_9BILA|nr:unnamed protein product [Didymodactylos carnosus]CAF3749839.1 unnamed protein product [Didymodactylos carnosus]